MQIISQHFSCPDNFILEKKAVHFKVILYSNLILKKMNERITVNISTNIHNERIKTKYIPLYIFENEGKIFKKFKKLEFLLRSGNCQS